MRSSGRVRASKKMVMESSSKTRSRLFLRLYTGVQALVVRSQQSRDVAPNTRSDDKQVRGVAFKGGLAVVYSNGEFIGGCMAWDGMAS